jgi:predicted nucleic acid-binding protein
VRLADLVLSCVDDGLFEICLSEHLLSEIERVLIESKGISSEKANVFVAAVASNAAQVAAKAGYVELAGEFTGPDPDDLLHLAAAVQTGCDILLTNNYRDFTKAVVPERFVVPTILTPEQFFGQLIANGLGSDLGRTIERISEKLKSPPRSPKQILDGLQVCGLIETAASLRGYLSR